ncbi:hypothetical protein J40TS1_34250 [Paenibacillus montaniterrae]|uniref:Uncharacterized protein n=1 Tax=Paenibacillus montaniterrae TaxID=429341 RepID=A0A920CZS7_9BACL|nr:hypothetical protein J40TS1_34250 [Paenibacillus montaniterrae]
MGEVRYKTCDRCNKEISEHQFPRFVIKVTKKFEYFFCFGSGTGLNIGLNYAKNAKKILKNF